MNVYKCKMCGASLSVTDNDKIVECEYCGSYQTLPKTKDENIQKLFNRANTLRQKNEFDKAEEIYERIIIADETESEAYWGVILCKYGIEYVEDPKTFKKIPTCHRTSYESIIVDEYYKKAIEYSDVIQKTIYEKEAKQIDEIQKNILAISSQEEPYDIFICYKETDENGNRTQDSIIAYDMYTQFTNEGFKVFYAPITLEDKLGSAYEPIIFAALNSSRVMISIGTKPEYFNAVWVKNEWSRFLKMMKNDKNKLLIPCYKGMDPYELPEEFSHLQAQDMNKIGYIIDIIRGIKKILSKDTISKVENIEKINTIDTPSVNSLISRARQFLEDMEWDKAEEYCEKVLDIDYENSTIYFYKYLISERLNDISTAPEWLSLTIAETNPFFKKALKFSKKIVNEELRSFIKSIKIKNCYIVTSKYDMPKNATTICIKPGSTEIGNEYFKECHNIECVIIPNSVERIGISAFEDCINIKNVIFQGKSKIIGIDLKAFKNCKGLTRFDIPFGAKGIGGSAFENCVGLTNVTIPNTVYSLGSKAFAGCVNLVNLKSPNNFRHLGFSVFKGCDRLIDKPVHQKNGGCYIATCVYGSYDCPQVWTLRRYRDNVLKETWYGRIFVRVYYWISPKLVRLFGNTKWFKKIWKNKLDKMVSKLQSKGFENTPYYDI